jgi:hypothetical protein
MVRPYFNRLLLATQANTRRTEELVALIGGTATPVHPGPIITMLTGIAACTANGETVDMLENLPTSGAATPFRQILFTSTNN